MSLSSSNSVAATAQVAGYGKHPAWSDHIEGLGAASPVLSKVEGELYLGAIGSLITTGEWPSASSSHPMARTVRRFLWNQAGDLVFGWMWPSADQVGRDHYPMILCVHLTGVDAGAALAQLDPLFAQAMQTIRAVRGREEVVAAVQELQVQSRKALQAMPPESEDLPLRRADEWVKSGPLDPTQWQRLLYFLKTQYADAAIAETGGRLTAPKRAGSQEFEGMRLPCPAASGLGGMIGWLAFLRSQLRASAPALLIQAEGAEWCDVIVGAVNATTLKPIQGGLEEVYPITDVPFEITPEFALEAQQALQAVGLGWGDSHKSSIFGPVPTRYRPNPAVGRPAPAAPKAPAPETPAPGSRTGEPNHPVRAAGSRPIPWIPIAVGGIALAGVVAFLVFRGGRSSPPSETNGIMAKTTNAVAPLGTDGSNGGSSSVAPLDGGDHSGRWLLYWEQYRQLKDVAAAAEPGSLWAEQVQASLGGLDPRNWEPWVVVFGGRDKVRGAEIDNIATSKLAAQAANLQRGAEAASRLMRAATNGYATSIRSRIPALAEGPAAGLIPGWQLVLAAPIGGRNPAAQVQALAGVEAQWRQASNRVAAWSTAWSQVAPVDPQQAALIRSNDLAVLRQLKDPAQFSAALDASIAAVLASRAWAQGALTQVDPAFLASTLSKLGSGLTWTGWSNAVVGAARVIGTSEVAALKDALRAETEGDRLKFLLKVRKDQGDLYRAELATLSGQFAEVSQSALVQANPAAVTAFRELQNRVTSASGRLQKAWSLVASPKAQVQLSRDTRKLATPLQEHWSSFLDLAGRKIDAEGTADAVAATLRWTETLEAAWSFFSALETATRDTLLTQTPQPLSGRVPEDVWRKDVWAALQSLAMDPATLRFRMDAPGALAGIQREAAGAIAVANAAHQLQSAWAGGLWTNTSAARGIVTGQAVMPAFQASLKAFNVDRFRALSTEIWAKPPLETGLPSGADVVSVSALCERIAAEPAWGATDGQWKLGCQLAGFISKAANWKDLTRQKVWLTRLWQARLGAGLPIESLSTVTAPLAAQSGLEGWLPAGFVTHQRWGQIAAALQAGQLNEGKRLVDALRAETSAGKLPESPANRAILDQLAALKLPEDPFDRVDWERTKANRPFNLEPKGASREAVATFASGIRITFVLPPSGVVAPVLIAREEVSARDLAAVLNNNPDLARRWAEQTVGGSGIRRNAGVDSQVASVWNNIGITAPPKSLSAGVPRIDSGSVYKGVDLRSFGQDGAELPANCISARLAEAIAAVLGCRLPSPSEWTDIQSRIGPVNFSARPKAVRMVSAELIKRWENRFEPSEVDIDRLTTPGDSSGTDRGSDPFFQPVSAGGDSTPQALRHWGGNVAEYLRDPQSGALSVAGGSFANPTVQPQLLDEKAKSQAYIDAGLRLVIDRVDLDQLGQAKGLIASVRLMAP